MNIDELRKICLAFPGATEQIQWEDNLLFKVGGRMFAVVPLEPSRVWLSLKADPEEFVELVEKPGIIPAPYLARAKWIAIEAREALPQTEVAALLRKSYELVFARLPERARRSLTSAAAKPKAGARKSEKRTRTNRK